MMRAAGFTLIELLVTLAVLGVLSTIAVPVGQTIVLRRQEQELRAALNEIRHAIDDYRRAVDDGRIAKTVGASAYPRTLATLVDGVPDQKSPKRSKIYFLRRLPRDPFAFAELTVEESWGKRSYASEPNDPREGDDVYDVYSRSERIGRNGIVYRLW